MSARLHAEGIGLSLGGHRVLDGATLALEPGEVLGLIGPNGAGKTTLVRALAGILRPETGTVRLDGEDIARLPRAARARRLAYLPQGAPCHWPLTVAAQTALGRLPHRHPWQGVGERDRAAIEDALARTEMTPMAGRTMNTLSGGERARALLARAIAGEAEILLADEPVASLDPAHQLRVMELFATHAREGGAVLMVLHDLSLAVRFCHRLALLDRGRVAAAGPPAAVLSEARLAAIYGIDAAIVDLEAGPAVMTRGLASRRDSAP